MDVKINVGEYVRISTKDDKVYTGLITAKGTTYANGGIYEFYQLNTIYEDGVAVFDYQIKTIEKNSWLLYLMTEINEIVKRHNFEVEEPGNIGNQAIAVIDNWAILEEVEKDIAAEFFYQTKMIKTIMDQNVLFKSLCQSAKEKIERLEKACKNGNL
ncbi:hypothetical protein [Blautia faecis]|uniref:hypothetical protein n=1 Tax=Blautia faecis TaxID=871665 RepID=UPI001D095ABF|nr:hypothetical protein [Blautia faecis]MCB6579525.1 hypothetical protein [Blautia faecis]MCB7291493.1 hypothetical protein [Blautia faecis]